MAGALVHVGIGLLAALVVHLVHFKLEYSLAIFVGSLLPDVLKFGFTALKQGTLSVTSMNLGDPFYQFWSSLTGGAANWFSVGFFVFGGTLLLYHFHYIKKKKMVEYDELYVFLLVGVVIHLILDGLIIEQGVWV
jgi:putative Mn2+ efflux pump MntP